jgi:hypothetical protein
MSEPQNNPEISSSAPDPDLKYSELQRLVNMLFAGLAITSFTLTAFLGLQAKRASEEATNAKTRAEELMTAAEQDDANIQTAFNKLAEYAHKHPDFQNQVLYKYKNNTTPPAK